MHFDELFTGREFDAGSRVVSDADVTAFVELSGDRNPLPLDGPSARETPFGGRIAHGALGVAIATGLVSQAGLTAGSLIALVELHWTFRAPIRPGDTVRARVRVADRRPGSRPDRGLVRFAVELRNQRDELVQEGELVEFIKR